ncbi:tyrosyl-DNA phosphodiesterase 2-like isoform X1 [Haliotis rufescens]|uniref:tyrosyl-DNA phosphodiesterase 2-like isoform X1 n=1 Tax=Haliotis rufescens TaxID=6454 RepID=UPI00201F9AA2|nr:tyrosyl-DNA phosphodiesterase 2-like isoform X1 [Haliotis rufescens]XP_046350901.2 tyrosyl-DNA phosphodiesterase 2-like isoform X1 [Haliotis rufescens]XP_046350902.2 tyrosyl-DNA phosphodiesterase 2-like isoform X1 [Haliotis rufescens]XP_046350903.2 tyrosyl-DNA phosphodiesterase 2-like isoform X1 [Haliotis rufescens]XP_048249331.1 tyrosyl-DNA phosphodiesterase 2-like isoform X1 [Haliotis rufescens]XP_048249337.1 tyrosyl-DNA phosphodiesterase 2-like isoform X1 [Haliotis rufescens]
MSDSEADSDVDEKNLPSREECEERCQMFAQVTGTDTALAMFFLQDREWNVETALNAYFAETGGEPVGSGQSTIVGTNTHSRTQTVRAGPEGPDPEPHRIRLLSWNLDGLDPGSIKSRMQAVCDIINKEKPHVVFLQEVTPLTLPILEDGCGMYQVIPGGDNHYFTAVMLRVGHVQFEDAVVTSFPTSKMLRNIITIKCHVKGISFQVMTSHLESTAAHSDERKRQLVRAFEAMKHADPDRTVIFGGDTNLRDKEVAQVGGIPEAIYDIWEMTGQRPEAKFTWDMRRNDNHEYPGYKSFLRLDRLYIRHCKPRSQVTPVYFELAGLARLPSHKFPSDHWGLLAHFDINGVSKPTCASV